MAKVLIVVDLQNDFIDGSLGTKEAAAIMPAALEYIRNWKGDLYYTKDTHYADYLKTPEGLSLPVQHCIKGTNGWYLNSDVEKLCIDKGGIGVEKNTFGAASLPPLLKERYPDGLEEIVLIGLCTDICVVSNALLLKAFFPDTLIVVDAACCAGVTPETHKSALDVLKMCQIRVDNA